MNILCCTKNNIKIMECCSHTHPSWEVILNKNGRTTSHIGDSVYEIGEGDIMVIPPGIAHDGKSDEYYTDMYFQADHLDFFAPLVVHDFDGSVLTLMNMLHKVMTEKEKNYSIIASNIAETICQYIKKYSKVDFRYPFVNELKNTIYKNISNTDFDLTKQIEKTGFNSDYLRRCFKQELGKTPLEYLTNLRLEQSMVLLKQDTFVSIEDVSARCGFNDSFYFSTCFKKHVGIPPLQYRKKYLIELN